MYQSRRCFFLKHFYKAITSTLDKSTVWLAFHKSYWVCIFIQNIAEVPRAFASFNAISELIDVLQFTISDKFFRLVPILNANSEIVKFNGLIQSSRRIFPGCGGLNICIIYSFLVIILIVDNIHIVGLCIISESDSPVCLNCYCPIT